MSKANTTTPRRFQILGLVLLSLVLVTGCGDASPSDNEASLYGIGIDMMPPQEATAGTPQSFFSFMMPAEPVMTSGTLGSNTVELMVLSGNGRVVGTSTRSVESGMAIFDDLTFEGSGPVTLQAVHVGSGIASEPLYLEVDGNRTWPMDGLPAGASVNDIVVESTDMRYALIVRLGDDRQNHLFLYDRKSETTEMVSLGRDGVPAGIDLGSAQMSDDGRYVAFMSGADNLTGRDSNGMCDVFVHDHQTGTTYLISHTPDGSSANDDSQLVSISANGRYVTFTSYATDLVEASKGGVAREIGPRTYRTDLALKTTVMVDGETR